MHIKMHTECPLPQKMQYLNLGTLDQLPSLLLWISIIVFYSIIACAQICMILLE